jgi:anti-sigma factor RsiW
MVLCREFQECLYEFVAGELPEERRKVFEDHLRNCAACSAGLTAYQRIIEVGGKLPQVPPPPGLLERFRKAVEKAKAPLCDEDRRSEGAPGPKAPPDGPAGAT